MTDQEKNYPSVVSSPVEVDCSQLQTDPKQSTEHQFTQDNYLTMDTKKYHPQPILLNKTNGTENQQSKKIAFKRNTYFQQVGEMIQNPSPMKYLIEGYIEEKSLNMIFGSSGVGKSFFAVDLSCTVATGFEWYRQKVRQGSVLYIAGEGYQGYAKRCQAWAKQNNVDLSNAPIWFSNTAINMCDSDSIKQLCNVADTVNSEAKEPVKLIVIDTFARAIDIDENNGQAVSRLIQTLDMLKEKYQCAILLVHHTGHQDQFRARGSTVLKGALDAEFRVTQDKDHYLKFECTKMKEAEAPKTMKFMLNDVELPIQQNERPVFKAALVHVIDDESDQQDTGYIQHLGKNQKLGLRAITEMLKAENPSCDMQWVRINAWRDKLLSEGLAKERFYEVKKGLLNAKCITISDDGEQVKLAA